MIVSLSCKNTGNLLPPSDVDDKTELKKDDGTAEILNEDSAEEDDWVPGESWAVKLKLKPQADENYLATEDLEIQALLSKHDVVMRQTMPPGPRSTPELLSYYTLTGKSSMSKESRENCIKDFLSTGKFEDEVFEYGISYGNN